MKIEHHAAGERAEAEVTSKFKPTSHTPPISKMAFRASSMQLMRATLRAQQPSIKPVFQPHVGRFTQGAVMK